jgi:asparagine synthase (glutamine-hydrolysing)
LYLQAMSSWKNPADVVTGAREPQLVRESLESPGSGANYYESMMLTDLLYYLPEDVLTKVDRASMAVSLEVRVPILDHRVVEFSWRLPLRFKIRNAVSKWALRRILYKYVPAELLERPKMGFGIPLGEWLRGPMLEWAEDLLAQSALEQHGLLHAQPIRQTWQEHVSGRKNWEYRLWPVLAFQDWYAQSGKAAAVSENQQVR